MRFALRNFFPGERSRSEDTHLDSFMASDNPPPAVQSLLRAIAADPRPHELGGFQEPLAHYRDAFPMSRPSVRKTWRTAMLSPIGASIAGLALALGGTAAAAYTGALPTSAQNFAHTVIGAPAAHPVTTPTQDRSSISTRTQDRTATGTATQDRSATGTATQDRSATSTRTQDRSATGTPVGPDASGPAAYELCTAWTQHQSNGASTNGQADDAVAFENLAAAAGGADKIAAYCATILKSASPTVPGAPNTERATSSNSHPAAKPTSLPTQDLIGKPSTMPPRG